MNKDNVEKVVSPKLVELCKWNRINEVNAMLDSGDTPNRVFYFLNRNNFPISRPLVYEYASLRKKAMINSINIEHMITVSNKPKPTHVIDNSDSRTKTQRSKLKSEIDALDTLIERGFGTLKDLSNQPINPRTMMEAIRLKASLTQGNHGFLTNYGMEHLREIEKNKYNLIIDHLVNYIPDNLKQEAIDKISVVEDSYYQTTDYYEEYLKALDLPEDEFTRRLNAYEKLREDEEKE